MELWQMEIVGGLLLAVPRDSAAGWRSTLRNHLSGDIG